MSIKSYVPPKLKLIDHRSSEGGYYTANCDICGTEYYPKRSNSKYCSPKCAVVSHRMASVSEKKQGGVLSKPKQVKKTGDIVKGMFNVMWWFESRGFRIRGLKITLKHMNVNETISWQGIDITKESVYKYRIAG
jgi:hypothetical protein